METEDKDKLASQKVKELLSFVEANGYHAIIMITAKRTESNRRMTLSGAQGNAWEIAEGLAILMHDNETLGEAIKGAVAMANLESLTEKAENEK